MELAELRSFVAVAEEQNFGRAAARLHLTQSPVSRAVKSLERELGGDLFVRAHHEVRLSPLGEALLPDAHRVLGSVAALYSRADLLTGPSGIVVVGGAHMAPVAVSDRFVEYVIEAVRPAEVRYVAGHSVELLPQVMSGDLALALVHLPTGHPELDAVEAASYRFGVAMRSDDPLAGQRRLRLSDLAGRRFTVQPTDPHPVALESLIQKLREAGITDLEQLPGYDQATLANHLRRTGGLSLAVLPGPGNPGTVSLATPEFSTVPLADGELSLSVAVVWRRDRYEQDAQLRATVDLFLARAREFYGR